MSIPSKNSEFTMPYSTVYTIQRSTEPSVSRIFKIQNCNTIWNSFTFPIHTQFVLGYYTNITFICSTVASFSFVTLKYAFCGPVGVNDTRVSVHSMTFLSYQKVYI